MWFGNACQFGGRDIFFGKAAMEGEAGN
jgi:hypothetical protein